MPQAEMHLQLPEGDIPTVGRGMPDD